MTRPWQPNWTIEPVPCARPETCRPQQPLCLSCVAGFRAFVADGHEKWRWAELEEWQREAWRREAKDA